MERALLARYEDDLELIERSLSAATLEAAAALAAVPALIRGYGHVKQANAERAAGERERLLERLRGRGRNAAAPGRGIARIRHVCRTVHFACRGGLQHALRAL